MTLEQAMAAAAVGLVTFPVLWRFALRAHASVDTALLTPGDRHRELEASMREMLEHARAEAAVTRSEAANEAERILIEARGTAKMTLEDAQETARTLVAKAEAELAEKLAAAERRITSEVEFKLASKRAEAKALIDSGLHELDRKAKATRARIRQQLAADIELLLDLEGTERSRKETIRNLLAKLTADE